MADKPITEAYAQELLKEQSKLEADKQALIEEFTKEIVEKGTLFSDEDVKGKIKEVLPDAFVALQSLINNSESDAVRANLVKFVFEIALAELKQEKKDNGPSTVEDLVKELSKNDTKKQKT